MIVITQKITQKEWKQYVQQQMYQKGFTKKERGVVDMVFNSDLHDAEQGEIASFFEHIKPGISEKELKDTMSALRDKNSSESRSARLQLHPEKIDELEGILHEALINNKERLF